MRTLVRFILSVIVPAIASAPAYAQGCSDDSAAAALALYKQRYDFIHDGAGSPPLTASLQTLVAANIEQNLKAGDVGAVDWDFWTDAQDGFSSPDAKAALISQHGAKAKVQLQYEFRMAPDSPPQVKVTDIHLVLSGSKCWLVEDLRHNGKSLSRLLQRGTRPSKKVQ
jgi:hypothetical protein